MHYSEHVQYSTLHVRLRVQLIRGWSREI